MQISIHTTASVLAPPSSSCALHAYLTLPSTLFLDRYQLSDPLFLASQNLASLRSISGETDLEKPDWVVDRWGSAALLELPSPSDLDSREIKGQPRIWNVSVPMHLRYLPPTDMGSLTAGQREIEVPWPIVFWACEAEEGLKMSVNPFDRVNLGYDGLFGPKTMFYHVPPAEGLLVAGISVPVLDVRDGLNVERGTAVVVLLGFAWVLYQLFGTIRGGKTAAVSREDKSK